MHTHRQSRAIGAIFAIAINAFALSGCSKHASNSEESPLPEPVPGAVTSIKIARAQQAAEGLGTERAHTGISATTLQFSSTVQPASNAIGSIYSPANGVVHKVLADVGDSVRAGQPLVIVTSPDIADAQAAYQNSLAKMQEVAARTELIKTRLQIANNNQHRLELLLKEGIAARKDVEASQAASATTKAELVAASASARAAEVELAAAEVKLISLGVPKPSTDRFTSRIVIRSPCSGVVINRNVSAGQAVGPASLAASGGNAAHEPALMTVANLKKVWAMLEVPQSQAAALSTGEPVRFETEVAPGHQFRGTITRLGERFDVSARTVQVRAEIDNDRQILKPGMLVIATVVLQAPSTSGVIVPSNAVQTLDSKTVVFIPSGKDRFVIRPVVLGAQTRDSVTITGGLHDGEAVVTKGSFALKTEAMRSMIGGENQ